MILGIFEKLGAGADVPLAPGSNDLKRRIERIDGQFEPDLVVALACCTVGNGIRADFPGYADRCLAISGRAMELPSRYCPS